MPVLSAQLVVGALEHHHITDFPAMVVAAALYSSKEQLVTRMYHLTDLLGPEALAVPV